MLTLFLLLPSVLLCGGCSDAEKNDDVATLRVVFFDTGKADAILLITPDGTVLCDTAEEDDGAAIAAYIKSCGYSAVDHLIVTHYDKDHAGGAAEIIGALDVGTVILPDYVSEKKSYLPLTEALSRAGITPIKLTGSEDGKPAYGFSLGGVDFRIYAAVSSFAETGGDDNAMSLIITAEYGGRTLLLAGDAPAERVSAVYDAASVVDILKVPYHGRDAEGYAELFKRMSAKWAVITCSDKNPADENILSALSDANTAYYLTQNGDIIISVDAGGAVTVKQ